MPAEVVVEAWVDAAIAEKATAVLAAQGLTVADAVRLLLTRTAEEGEMRVWAEDHAAAGAPEEEPAGYDAWFRGKVQEALNDPRPGIPHEEVLDYLEGESVQVADSVDARIRESTELLSRFPALGRRGRVPGTREMVIQDTSYLVAYRIEGHTVSIVRLLHGARLWPRTAAGLHRN